MPCFGSPQTLEEVQQAVSDYITYYNELRITKQIRHESSRVQESCRISVSIFLLST